LNTALNSFPEKLLSASRNFFWVFLWLTAISLLLFFPLRWLSGDALEPVRTVSYITPWLLILALPMLVIAGWRRRKWLAFVLVMGMLAIVVSFAPLFLPNRPAQPSPQDVPLKIMSYNLHGIPEIDGIVAVIRREQPDILLIQECSPALGSPAFHGLEDLYPEASLDLHPGSGQAIFSRYPLKEVRVELEKGRTQKMRIETPAGSIAVWNVHPVPPFLVPPELFDAHMAALVADIAQAKGPLIVAGDFNATRESEAYQSVSDYLQDAHWEAGSGFGFTYPAPPYTFMDMPLPAGPLWRIDYVFHSRDFLVTDARTLETAGGSDHFPIVVELAMVKK
jgi:endonuclease/exonuclease/phosphatase (EEP) superfamily protein YafD